MVFERQLPEEMMVYAERLYDRFPELLVFLGSEKLNQHFALPPRPGAEMRLEETAEYKSMYVRLKRLTPLSKPLSRGGRAQMQSQSLGGYAPHPASMVPEGTHLEERHKHEPESPMRARKQVQQEVKPTDDFEVESPFTRSRSNKASLEAKARGTPPASAVSAKDYREALAEPKTRGNLPSSAVSAMDYREVSRHWVEGDESRHAPPQLSRAACRPEQQLPASVWWQQQHQLQPPRPQSVYAPSPQDVVQFGREQRPLLRADAGRKPSLRVSQESLREVGWDVVKARKEEAARGQQPQPLAHDNGPMVRRDEEERCERPVEEGMPVEAEGRVIERVSSLGGRVGSNDEGAAAASDRSVVGANSAPAQPPQSPKGVARVVSATSAPAQPPQSPKGVARVVGATSAPAQPPQSPKGVARGVGATSAPAQPPQSPKGVARVVGATSTPPQPPQSPKAVAVVHPKGVTMLPTRGGWTRQDSDSLERSNDRAPLAFPTAAGCIRLPSKDFFFEKPKADPGSPKLSSPGSHNPWSTEGGRGRAPQQIPRPIRTSDADVEAPEKPLQMTLAKSSPAQPGTVLLDKTSDVSRSERPTPQLNGGTAVAMVGNVEVAATFRGLAGSEVGSATGRVFQEEWEQAKRDMGYQLDVTYHSDFVVDGSSGPKVSLKERRKVQLIRPFESTKRYSAMEQYPNVMDLAVQKPTCWSPLGLEMNPPAVLKTTSKGMNALLRPLPGAFPMRRTLICFDWDDTLCPTSWIRRLLVDHLTDAADWVGHADGDSEWREHVPDWFAQPLPDSPVVQEAIGELQRSVIDIFNAAQALGIVCIVTNAVPGWVEKTTRKWLPKLGQYIFGHGNRPKIHVLYGQREYKTPDRQRSGVHLSWVDELGELMLWKKAAIDAALTNLDDLYRVSDKEKGESSQKSSKVSYSTDRGSAGLLNLLSIGDSEAEMQAPWLSALTQSFGGSGRTAGRRTRRAVSAPPALPLHSSRPHVKVLKFMDSPHLRDVVVQLGHLKQLLPELVTARGHVRLNHMDMDTALQEKKRVKNESDALRRQLHTQTI